MNEKKYSCNEEVAEISAVAKNINSQRKFVLPCEIMFDCKSEKDFQAINLKKLSSKYDA